MKFIQTKVIDELFLIFFINYFIIICFFNLDFFYIIYDLFINIDMYINTFPLNNTNNSETSVLFNCNGNFNCISNKIDLSLYSKSDLDSFYLFNLYNILYQISFDQPQNIECQINLLKKVLQFHINESLIINDQLDIKLELELESYLNQHFKELNYLVYNLINISTDENIYYHGINLNNSLNFIFNILTEKDLENLIKSHKTNYNNPNFIESLNRYINIYKSNLNLINSSYNVDYIFKNVFTYTKYHNSSYCIDFLFNFNELKELDEFCYRIYRTRILLFFFFATPKKKNNNKKNIPLIKVLKILKKKYIKIIKIKNYNIK